MARDDLLRYHGSDHPAADWLIVERRFDPERLADAHGNTADGIHTASCGGTWLALVAGFGGLRDGDGEVRFDPRLPAEWTRLHFRVEVRGQVIEVDMTAGATTYRLVQGRGLLIEHRGEQLRLNPGEPVMRAEEGLALAA